MRDYWRSSGITSTRSMPGTVCDRGQQYRPAIFHHGDEQKRLAEESKQALEQSGRFQQPVVVAIEPASTFIRPRITTRLLPEESRAL